MVKMMLAVFPPARKDILAAPLAWLKSSLYVMPGDAPDRRLSLDVRL